MSSGLNGLGPLCFWQCLKHAAEKAPRFKALPLSTIDLHYVGFLPHLPIHRLSSFILMRFTELILEGSYSEFSVVRMKQRLRLRGKIQGAASPPLFPVICFVMQLRIPLLCQNPFACCSTLSQGILQVNALLPDFVPLFLLR